MPQVSLYVCLPSSPPSDEPRRWWLTDSLPENVTVTEDPDADFVLVPQFGPSMTMLAQAANPRQVRIHWALEAVVPNFNIFDYAIGFDRLSFGDRYVRMHPLTCMSRHVDLEPLLDMSMAPPPPRPERFCDYIYSNGGAHSMRSQLFHRLSEYKTVDSYGSHLNNTDDRILRTSWDSDWCGPKIPLHREHSFSLAIENALHRGYTTEKLATAVLAGTMPIYWGNPDVGLDFNAERFVNVHDYPTLDDAVDRVIELDNDEDLMREALERPFLTDQQVRSFREANDELASFLRAIFDQDPASARRRAEGPHQRMQEEAFVAQTLGPAEPAVPPSRWGALSRLGRGRRALGGA